MKCLNCKKEIVHPDLYIEVIQRGKKGILKIIGLDQEPYIINEADKVNHLCFKCLYKN